MLITLRWLLSPTDASRGSLVRLAAGSVFAALALWSSFLALRAAPVGFDERQRDLETLAAKVPRDDDLVFLGLDRFAGYYLRGTLARSPGGYVPAELNSRASKSWQQGQAIDFDTLEPQRLQHQEFAITTAAAFQSGPPPNWREVAREGDYVLWEREGKGPEYEVMPDEGGDPGAAMGCAVEGFPSEAVVWPKPVVGEQDGWSPSFAFDAPGRAAQELDAPAGQWELSLQYHSQVPLTVFVDGEEVADLRPSLEGFYLTGAGRGAFWPAGELDSVGGPVEIEVEAADPSGLQDALGVERMVWLGRLALASTTPPEIEQGALACGKYTDHFLPE
jgi:hypothetical protein